MKAHRMKTLACASVAALAFGLGGCQVADDFSAGINEVSAALTSPNSQAAFKELEGAEKVLACFMTGVTAEAEALNPTLQAAIKSYTASDAVEVNADETLVYVVNAAICSSLGGTSTPVTAAVKTGT